MSRLYQALQAAGVEFIEENRWPGLELFALVADSVCVLRYDNEAGKGDHRHIGGVEKLYKLVDPETLLVDFWNDIEAWRR